MLKVAIIQREIPHYRGAFFEKLCELAKVSGLNITVYCGWKYEEKDPRTFQYRILPMVGKVHGFSWLVGLRRALKGSDIIIASHELHCLTVPYLWLQRHRLSKLWIWWGHGYNFQRIAPKNPLQSLAEAAKRFMIVRGDGLIAYTASGAEYWRQRGMPADQAIPYFNTIDVEGLREAASHVTQEMLEQVQSRLDLKHKRVLLFSGRLYAKKKVDFLLKAVEILQRKREDLALLILGDGGERANLKALCQTLNLRHVHFLGEINEPQQTSLYFRLAELLVIPGLVGLAIVHGFAHGLPIVTTEHDFHSPEIEYLSKDNGVMTSHTVQAYADGIQKILDEPAVLESMRRAATLQGDRLALRTSAARFAEAIRKLSDHHDAMKGNEEQNR